MLLGILGASSLGIMVSGKSVTRAGDRTIRAGETFCQHLIL